MLMYAALLTRILFSDHFCGKKADKGIVRLKKSLAHISCLIVSENLLTNLIRLALAASGVVPLVLHSETPIAI